MNTKRFNVELDTDTYNRLKGLLATQGVSISQWIRLTIKVYLDSYEDEVADEEN